MPGLGKISTCIATMLVAAAWNQNVWHDLRSWTDDCAGLLCE